MFTGMLNTIEKILPHVNFTTRPWGFGSGILLTVEHKRQRSSDRRYEFLWVTVYLSGVSYIGFMI